MPFSEKNNIPSQEPDRETSRIVTAEQYYQAAAEWLDLTKELHADTGKRWKNIREDDKDSAKSLSLAEQMAAIQAGKIGILAEAKESNLSIDDQRFEQVKQRLSELDAIIREANENPDLKPEVREKFRRERQFQKIGLELDSLEAYEDDLDSREFQLVKMSKGKITEVERKMLQEFLALKNALETRKQDLEFNPETALAVRLHELRRHQESLKNDGFAETPSRKKYLDEIQKLWEEGKNVFLSGPTGTGKTELFNHLGKKLYGESPEIIRGSERTGAAEIFGKMLLKATPAGGTETYFQPGRYTTAINKGKPLVFDEFNLLDPKVRFQLKELYNRKAGDQIIIQEDTGKQYAIKEGFSFGATANIKSEKHKERFELDAAETRVFEMRRIDYLPKEELYDLCLAKLMDKRGGVRLSGNDAAETLKRFVESAEMIQKAFLGTQTAMYEEGGGTKKKYASLEKAVLDPGKALGMLEGWPVAEAKGRQFSEYLNDHLRDFLNQEDFPEKDRKLLLKILITKGFFQGRDPAEFDAGGITAKEMIALGWMASVKILEKMPPYLRPEDVARLDPFEIRKGKIAAIGDEFLAGVPETAKPKEAKEERLDFREAREFLGKDFFGPEEVKETYGVDIAPEELPPLPSRQELEKAKELGERLILRVREDNERNPITMEYMQKLLEPKFSKAGKGKILYNTDWYKDESFYTADTSKLEWKFVSKNILPGSVSKNYIEQTHLLRDYLAENNLAAPQELSECTDAKLDQLQQLMGSNWQEAAKQLSELLINQNHRRIPVEALYDIVLIHSTRDEKHLENYYDWTSRLSSDGRIVSLGGAGADGANVDDWGARRLGWRCGRLFFPLVLLFESFVFGL